MNKLNFLIAGIPETTESPADIHKGLQRVQEMGIDGMELEFVHNIWLNDESAKKVGLEAENLNLILTIHAPYYINLNSKDNKIKYGSISRIVKTAQIGIALNAFSITFHPGYYLLDSKEDALEHMKETFQKILKPFENNPNPIFIRPETTGKGTQFGDLDELLTLSKLSARFSPCIDFAHLHARTDGKYNSYDEFMTILDKVNATLGEIGIKNMHMHYSGIEYSGKGERRHLSFKNSDAKYTELLRALKSSGVAGALVCESPERDTDTKLLKDTYNSI